MRKTCFLILSNKSRRLNMIKQITFSFKLKQMKKQKPAILLIPILAFLISIQRINAQQDWCKHCDPRFQVCICETYAPKPRHCRCVNIFYLARQQKISVKIFDESGRIIKSAAGNEIKIAGHEIMWDYKDDKGNSVPPGIYFVKLEGDNYSEARKITVIK